MNNPRTYLNDYESFEREQNDLRRNLVQGRISQDESDQMEMALQDNYRNKIFPEDEYIFEDIGGLLGFLIDNSLSVRSIGHERMHGVRAKQLGYTVQYGCRLFSTGNDNEVASGPFVRVLGKITPEDLISIVSAPDKLSGVDVDMLNSLKPLN